MCGSGPSRIWRHNSIRDLLAKAIENVGFKVGFEHNGGLPDDRRPGDIIVYNWERDKHLLIDVGVTNALAAHNRSALLRNGPGGGAAATEKTKRDKYKDIDHSTYIYLPFILETSGAFGEPALQLCSKLRKIWLTKCCSGNDSPNFKPWQRSSPQHETVDPLLVSISVLLQTHNGQMILERTPLSPKLLDSEIARSQARTKTQQKWAVEKLQTLNNESPATLRRFSAWTKEGTGPTHKGKTGTVEMSNGAPPQTPDPSHRNKTGGAKTENGLVPHTPGPRTSSVPTPTLCSTQKQCNINEKPENGEPPWPPSATTLGQISSELNMEGDISRELGIGNAHASHNTSRAGKQIMPQCDTPTKAPLTTKNYGLPRDITETESEHLFGHKPAPDTPAANRSTNPSKTPTANRLSKLSTTTPHAGEHNHRDREASQSPQAIPGLRKSEALQHLPRTNQTQTTIHPGEYLQDQKPDPANTQQTPFMRSNFCPGREPETREANLKLAHSRASEFNMEIDRVSEPETSSTSNELNLSRADKDPQHTHLDSPVTRQNPFMGPVVSELNMECDIAREPGSGNVNCPLSPPKARNQDMVHKTPS